MRLYGRATFFRDCARFGLFNAKMHTLPLFYLFGVIFDFFGCFLPILLAKNFQTEVLVAHKKLLLESLHCSGGKFSYKVTMSVCLSGCLFAPSGAFSLNWPHWAGSVIESPCPDVCVFLCLRHRVQFFSRPLIGPEIT